MKHSGFTLIELLTVITIISLMMAFGYPAYQANLRETRRQDAIQGLLDMQLAVEGYITQNNELPAASDYFAANKDSAKGYYKFTYSIVNASLKTYQIIATAQGDQASDTASGATSCATITLLSTVDGTTPYQCK